MQRSDATLGALTSWCRGVQACAPFASSKSHSLMVPPAAPATTTSSALSKVTHSTGLWWPDRLCSIPKRCFVQQLRACLCKIALPCVREGHGQAVSQVQVFSMQCCTACWRAQRSHRY